MLWVDSHVHVYPCFSIARFLAAAVENMGPASPGTGRMLLLAESAGNNVFAAWRDSAGGTVPGADEWRVVRRDEDCTLGLDGPGRKSLLLVAGRQIATRERLEVLALGTTGTFGDGRLSAADVIEAVAAAGALPVIPWGAGKWLAGRGKVLAGLIANPPAPFALGDNAGRPWAWPAPVQFCLARSAGIQILAGSDPLPLRGEETTVGRCGMCIDEASADEPFASIRERLLARPARCYGRREGLFRFVRNWVAMQERK